MMTDIDSGKIGTVLVKDMSRVGRNYLETGFYTEIMFRKFDVRFIAIHPKPPLATRKHVARDKLIRNLSDATRGMPTIVAGDANATPWSSALLGPHSRDLARITGLAPTYPTEGGGILGVSIDHVLVSPHFAMVQTERGPDIGSDHLPVRGELRLMDK